MEPSSQSLKFFSSLFVPYINSPEKKTYLNVYKDLYSDEDYEGAGALAPHPERGFEECRLLEKPDHDKKTKVSFNDMTVDVDWFNIYGYKLMLPYTKIYDY